MHSEEEIERERLDDVCSLYLDWDLVLSIDTDRVILTDVDKLAWTWLASRLPIVENADVESLLNGNLDE